MRIKQRKLFLFVLIKRSQVALLIAQGHFNDFARADTKAINNLTIKLNPHQYPSVRISRLQMCKSRSGDGYQGVSGEG